MFLFAIEPALMGYFIHGISYIPREYKVIGAQGLGPLGDRMKQADRHEVPEESTTKQPNQI